ncbi:MAG: acyl-CoA dehydratase activase-related protein [Eubacteriales bacterium]|nr:acyl-CoA dehydratase activase-related protein [Eubacteriales bacterium]MDD3199496.1 acyl-CoA dehydratase activase-related protein [Eubacteriales bacterium]
MKIGIPGGLLYYKYEPFIRTFFNEMGVDTEYSVKSNKEILDLGIRNCVDEACLPMKLFHGHTAKLQNTCDFTAAPRLMNCEFGESICPKFHGLPELISAGTGKSNQLFTEPIYLNDQKKLKKVLKKNCRCIGVPDVKIDKAYQYAMENQRNTSFGIKDSGYRHRVFLAGHPYNIYDSFANLNLLQKLHNLDIGVVTEERVCRNEKLKAMAGLIKRPYWLFFIHNFAPAISLMQRKEIDGIVYVSSFCCGTDSITIEMIKNRAAGFPVLVLKLDEQTGEAGYNTRLEAFREVL